MNALGAGIAIILLGALSAVLPRRHPIVAKLAFPLLVVAGCACSAIAALGALTVAPAEVRTVPTTLPGGAWVMGLDGLSAWFLLLLSVVGGITTVFGVAYLNGAHAGRRVGAAHATWAVLLAAMIGVLASRSALPFLVTWEVMALSAYFLIMFEHDRDEVRRAGLVYLVLTHLGTLGLLVMFLAWGHAASSYSFAGLAAARANLPWAGAGVLLLALFGFGIKAGVFPFHFWLPGAHASAPSHVSALLSGVMLKMGIYGLLRVVDLLGPPPAWWGWTLLALGLASAVLGILWALAQRDLKRALAYSSVENVGIIVLGLGLGALGTAYHQPAIALLGYAAALLHALNHSLFKSLLFLGAGAVLHGTGTREIDRLGGLARRMPRTALAFLLGSIAIVGLPPLNGFVGEWILIRGFLTAGRQIGPLRWTSLGAAAIGLVAALALACFVRLVGAVFLGQPREQQLHGHRDADSTLSLPMWLLAAACAFIALVPAIVLRCAVPVAQLVAGAGGMVRTEPMRMDPSVRLGLFASSILAVVAMVWLLRFQLAGRAPRRPGPTWGCAFAETTARMQVTGSSFSAPLLGAFPVATGARRSHIGATGRGGTGDRILRDVARPLWGRIQALALSVRPLQQGRVTTYLQYMIWTLLLLLGFLLFAGAGPRP